LSLRIRIEGAPSGSEDKQTGCLWQRPKRLQGARHDAGDRKANPLIPRNLQALYRQ